MNGPTSLTREKVVIGHTYYVVSPEGLAKPLQSRWNKEFVVRPWTHVPELNRNACWVDLPKRKDSVARWISGNCALVYYSWLRETPETRQRLEHSQNTTVSKKRRRVIDDDDGDDNHSK